jgi:hypothetical protein
MNIGAPGNAMIRTGLKETGGVGKQPKELSALAKRVEAFLAETRMDPQQFGLEVFKERHLVRDLRKGRNFGPVFEARIMAYLSARQFKHPETDGVLKPSLQTMEKHDRIVCGRMQVEAEARRIPLNDLLAQVCLMGWAIYASQRGLD